MFSYSMACLLASLNELSWSKKALILVMFTLSISLFVRHAFDVKSLLIFSFTQIYTNSSYSWPKK